MFKYLLLTVFFVAVAFAQNSFYNASQFESSTVGWLNIEQAPGYEYGASIIIEDGVVYLFHCSPGNWDVIRVTTSADGITYTPPTIALQPNNVYNSESTCDPSVVKFNGIYHMYHTCISNIAPDGYINNRICLATSPHIAGPYTSVLEPVLQDLSCSPNSLASYCVGQPSALIYNSQVYLYFTNQNSDLQVGPNPGFIFLAVSNDGINFNTANQGLPVYSQRDVDIKYDRVNKLFFMIQGDVGDVVITWSVSQDGMSWLPYNRSRTIATPDPIPGWGLFSNHNPGIAGSSDGSFAGQTFVTYATSYADSLSWWRLYQSDIVINSAQYCDVFISCDWQCSYCHISDQGWCQETGLNAPAPCNCG